MAWTLSGMSIVKDAEVAVLQVGLTITNGVTTRIFSYRVSDATSIAKLAADNIRQLTAIDAAASSQPSLATVQTQVAALLAVPPPPPTPTAAELAQQKFFVDYQLLRQMRVAIQAGLKTGTDADVVAQIALVKSEFLLAYLPLIS